MPNFVAGWKREHRGHRIRQTMAGTYVAEVNRDGKRLRTTVDSVELARAWIDTQERNRDEHGRIATSITARQTRDALDALAHLKATGHEVSLLTAVQYYSRQHQSGPGWTVEECMARQKSRMESPQDGGSPARPRSVENKVKRLKSFVALHGTRKIIEITKTDVDEWLASTGAQGRNLLNNRIEIQGLFNFAARHMEPPGSYTNTVARFPQRKKKEVAPAEIVPPHHARAVLHKLEELSPEAAVTQAIACFAGLRTAELVRGEGLRWEDIDFTDKLIRVPSSLAKTRDDRELPIMPNLLAWLLKYRKLSGRIALDEWPFHKRRVKACKALGIHWPDNGARHSFGTYIAKLHGYREAADRLGHVGGIAMLKAHYCGRCTKEQAEAFFQIEPAETGTIIQYASAKP